jgi:hypothetical protein
MEKAKHRTRKTRRKFRTVWGELEYVCARIHDLCYVKRSKRSAISIYLPRLRRLLRQLPENDMAILREEGLALLHELGGDTGEAIKHRKREIQLMERLHADVGAGDYDEKMKASILVGRDLPALEARREILRALKKEENSRPS